MTALTTKLGLRYPTGTDSPCEGGQQIIDLRDDIYSHLDDYVDTVARQADLPMVSVAWLGAPQLFSTGTVRYNTVEQDDLRAADLTTAADQVVLGKPGFEGTYLVGFLVQGEQTNGYTMNMSGDMISTFSPYDQDMDSWWRDTSLTLLYPMLCGSSLALIGGPTTLTLSPPAFLISLARMWAVRIGGI